MEAAKADDVDGVVAALETAKVKTEAQLLRYPFGPASVDPVAAILARIESLNEDDLARLMDALEGTAPAPKAKRAPVMVPGAGQSPASHAVHGAA